MVNLEAARNLDFAERLHTIFNRHATNMIELAPPASKIHRDAILGAADVLYTWAENGTMPFTAAAMPPANAVFLDLENMDAVYNSFTSTPGSLAWHFTQQDETLLKRAIFMHENAHITLGLEEAGSDFVAAVTMLRHHPESRSTLETLADLRAVSVQNTASNTKYGIECYEAIHHALALPPEQIADMSDDEMLGMAHYFDDMNTMNNNSDLTSAEQKAGITLSGEIKKLMPEEKSSDLASVFFAPSPTYSPDIIQEAIKQSKAILSPGSEEHKIMETVENSFNNLMENHIAPQDTPAPSPEQKPHLVM